MSPVHEGGIHFAAHARATVPVIYVKAASTAFLETDASETLSSRCQKHPSQATPVPCLDTGTANVARIFANDDNKP